METLAPDERLAFVLHDMFGVPFDDIASIIDRSPAAARQLASRARRRVRGAAPAPDADLDRQRKVVDAFIAAVRDGDFEALLAVLDPEVVLRSDRGPHAHQDLRGARLVAGQARLFSRFAGSVQAVLVNGAAGLVSWLPGGQPFSVMSFTVRHGKIVAIDAIGDPARLRRLNLTNLTG